MEFLSVLGKNIKKYRVLHNLSQEELAYMLSINMSNISRIELGKQFASAETLQAIINIFQIEPYQLFEEENIQPKKKKRTLYRDKLISYLSVQSEQESKYFFEAFKLYMKYKCKSKTKLEDKFK